MDCSVSLLIQAARIRSFTFYLVPADKIRTSVTEDIYCSLQLIEKLFNSWIYLYHSHEDSEHHTWNQCSYVSYFHKKREAKIADCAWTVKRLSVSKFVSYSKHTNIHYKRQNYQKTLILKKLSISEHFTNPKYVILLIFRQSHPNSGWDWALEKSVVRLSKKQVLSKYNFICDYYTVV